MVVALLRQAQRALHGVALAQKAARAQHGDAEQQERGPRVQRGEDELDAARRILERRRERPRERRQVAVDHTDAREPRRQVRGIPDARHDRFLQVARGVVELGHLSVGLHPEVDRARHEADAAEAQEHVDHAGDVVRVVAALAEALASAHEVRLRMVERESRLAIPEQDRHLVLVLCEVVLVARLRVLLEVADRVLLRVRPRALGADVRAHAADDVQLSLIHI